MKQTLLSIVQDILSDIDSEDVNSISDTVEAGQVARHVRSTFYNMVATRDIPEHKELLKLTAASDSEYPTHFRYGDNVKEVIEVWYEGEDSRYHRVQYKEPLDFLNITDRVQGDDVKVVLDKNGGTKLRISTDKNPDFYTSFDDNWLVFNSHDKALEATLQESKVRAYGTVYPVFQLTDSYVPDIDATMFPYLVAEAKSLSQSLLKGGSDPKVEQAARRQKSYLQNDMYRTEQRNARPNYGRR